MATTGKIGDVFGWANNPIYQNLASNKNALMSFGAGLASGNSWSDGLANGVGAIPIGAARDDAYALMQDDKAKQAEALNQTTEWLRANGKDALYAAVQSGAMAPSQAWQIALDEDAQARSAANAGPNLTADMQNYMFAQNNPGFADFVNPPKDPGSGVPMNSTIQKELFEADEALQAGQAVITGLDRALELNPQAWDGPFADQRSGGAALFGNQDAVATQELKNVVTSQALESLKAVFGGMPTEGERKILLEIQGSVDQPKAVREAIYTRAKAAAERRIAENARKAAALRSGQYFDSGYSAQTPASPNTTSTGLSWSIEP